MQKLTIFDDGELVGHITKTDKCFLIFARTSRGWGDLKRLSGFASTLEEIAKKAHDYNYNTELNGKIKE
jgi:hypothetical protein